MDHPRALPKEAQSGTRVLVIDDDQALTALTRVALAKHGIEVDTAATASEGLARLATTSPSLVITGIVLPDLSGWDVVRRIRATSSVLVMVLSGRDADAGKARGLDLGADDYLAKPFSLIEFETRIRALLRRAQLRQFAFRS